MAAAGVSVFTLPGVLNSTSTTSNFSWPCLQLEGFRPRRFHQSQGWQFFLPFSLFVIMKNSEAETSLFSLSFSLAGLPGCFFGAQVGGTELCFSPLWTVFGPLTPTLGIPGGCWELLLCLRCFTEIYMNYDDMFLIRFQCVSVWTLQVFIKAYTVSIIVTHTMTLLNEQPKPC